MQNQQAKRQPDQRTSGISFRTTRARILIRCNRSGVWDCALAVCDFMGQQIIHALILKYSSAITRQVFGQPAWGSRFRRNPLCKWRKKFHGKAARRWSGAEIIRASPWPSQRLKPRRSRVPLRSLEGIWAGASPAVSPSGPTSHTGPEGRQLRQVFCGKLGSGGGACFQLDCKRTPPQRLQTGWAAANSSACGYQFSRI